MSDPLDLEKLREQLLDLWNILVWIDTSGQKGEAAWRKAYLTCQKIIQSLPAPQAATPDPRPALLDVAMELLEEWPLPKMGNPLREELADARRELRRAVKDHKKAGAEAPAPSVWEAAQRAVDAWKSWVAHSYTDLHQKKMFRAMENLNSLLAAQPGKEDKEGEDGKQG